MNFEYWNKFYSDVANTNPSTFAKFCLKYISPNDTLLDVGCGDGRDSIFFAQKLKNIISVDSSTKTIGNLKNKYQLDNIEFQVVDIDSLRIFNDDSIAIVYCRFLLHAIIEESEDILLNWSYNILPTGGRIMIEARTEEDEHLSKHYDNHDRRYINSNKLRKKLQLLNFKIIHEEQGIGLSPYKSEDPHLVRFIAEK